jgi:hypothetical protein
MAWKRPLVGTTLIESDSKRNDRVGELELGTD